MQDKIDTDELSMTHIVIIGLSKAMSLVRQSSNGCMDIYKMMKITNNKNIDVDSNLHIKHSFRIVSHVLFH